jgi:hypothetical protein
MWDQVINAVGKGELAEIQLKSDAAGFRYRLKQSIESQRQIVKRNLSDESISENDKKSLCSIDKLLIVPAERLCEALSECISGPHRMEKHIQVLADRIALTVLCGFIAEVICRSHRCVSRAIDPLLEQLRKPVLDRMELKLLWPVMKAEILLATNRSNVVANVMNKPFKRMILNSELLSEATRAQISTTMHIANNKHVVFEAVDYYVGSVEEIIGKASFERSEIVSLEQDLLTIRNPLKSIHILPFPHEEPVDFVDRMFGGVKVVRAADLSTPVDRRILNMMISHFIINARQYPADDRPLNIMITQEHNAIVIEDNGRGINVERLAQLQDVFTTGKRVDSERESGTGSGIRDSAVLLAQLLKENGELDCVALSIASRATRGTRAKVAWGPKARRVSIKGVPRRWGWVQLSCEVDNRAIGESDSIVRINGNVGRPKIVQVRSLSNLFGISVAQGVSNR